ncbi:bifunctional demethylmenaquinone methyltransferase/2-methoxy-6-polyprenyl-1,4-benzoquinol methylase UbiE [Candidatus Rhabdochlamydia porcellionis]|jgi:demethylmenaquinone methyltransferase / 2-methoxy-6-polyprenyl-1,4-benzoquinol methylase|uniref:Demethylmenaquinone methyltransferase n=1 Tax=Candidatus Rhabdochlamydia porcellionis TaxID=225148 RepID=A0ABX8YZC5_9BACT|nr:bifunctional demethylmenaquinone methyltransferase/2-methoxy-6-polyprenyl-1,4-benzoquinol methylase UbiE [Candidatus Rhabdochlamydia porcellionis]QZA58710.1 Ubiquinone/menaquinone biosynthesis C-methyltransferase UbiE [Candidatus Rhabdochlamydia porcellionis]
MLREKNPPSRFEIWKMFDKISLTYDLVNRVMTFGLDGLWRKKMTAFLPEKNPLILLDCATGTADQLLAFMRYSKKITSAIGIDLSQEMLQIANKKIKKKGYDSCISLQEASLLNLPFEDCCFDCISISFGIRNVMDVHMALQECFRVLKPQGRLIILEGTVPHNRLLKVGHRIYLRYLLPFLGGLISGQPQAYQYLNDTIFSFPCGESFCTYLRDARFTSVKATPLTGGAVFIYQGDRMT